ncbi:MAG: HAMP domain-containing sensor histidine kinase [Ardenticatenales bacterium]
MLSALRVRLTLLYLGIGLAFLLLVGAGSYGLLRGYYRTSTDLALQHRLVGELHRLGVAAPSALTAADAEWYATRGRSAPTPSNAAPHESEDRDAERSGGDDGDGAHGGERPDESAAEESYDGDLAVIFVRPFSVDGEPLAGASANLSGPSSVSSADALTNALAAGSDWRTVRAADGTGVRLLTYRIPSEFFAGPALLQLGRPLDDQERVLRRLLAVLLGLGSVSALLLAGAGWWVAGRSLQPAERAWRQQQAFVANASHELRTPLTLIRASAEVLGRGLPPAGEHRALIDDILTECDHTSQLVSDLLLLSRLDAGQLDMRREPVAVAVLIGDVARQFGRLAATHDIDLAVGEGHAGVGEPIVVEADPTRLRQVLIALLDNAMRHTPPKGQVRLVARGDGDRATIVVADTGEGIAPEHLPHVFERFYRAGPTDRDSGDGGAGLGLAVAESLVRAMGGRLTLESEPGYGTRVTIELAARPANPKRTTMDA